MENFSLLVAIGVFIYAILKNSSHEKMNSKNLSYILGLEKRIKQLEQLVNSEKPITKIVPPKLEDPNVEPQKTTFASVAEAPQFIGQFKVQDEEVKEQILKTNVPFKKPQENPNSPVNDKVSEFWQKIETQFIENWTGILGAVIMVVGVGFLGVYAALNLSAFNRFLIITAFAGILGGLFYYLKKQDKWLKLALWLRSSAGAIFLFACLGSAVIPGLQWINDPMYGLLILIAGILLNLYLGYVGGNQVFASLHVLLSLVALSIAPQSTITLVIAALVALFGIALTFREKWDYHLLLTISSFFFYHLYWYFQQPVLSFNTKIVGIITILIISVTVGLVHYRTIYKTKTFDTLPFIVHLINWFYFGIGLFMHSTGAQVSTFFIACGSVAAFFLARRAKKLEIRWLYHTDTIMAQVAAIISIITLYKWHLDVLIIIAFIFIETILFLYIMLKEEEEFLYKVGVVLLNVLGIILLIYSIKTLDYTNTTIIYSHSAALFACFILGTTFHLYSFKKNKFDLHSLYRSFEINFDPKIQTPFFNSILGLLLIAVYLNIYKIEWTEYFIVATISVLLFIRNKFQSLELAITSIIPLIGIHIICWSSYNKDLNEITMCIHYLPFLIVSALSIKWSFVEYFNKYFNWIGIYLFAIHTIIITYFIFNPISSLIPATAWLVLSVVALELSNYTGKKFVNEPLFKNHTDRFLLQIGYCLIFAFLIRHVMVDLQSEQYVAGIIKIRLVIEIFALGVFTFWATTKKPPESNYKSWGNLHPLFLELIVSFSVLIISLEATVFWQPIIWISIAFLLGILGNWKKEIFSRLIFYSLVFYWITSFQNSFIISSYVTPSSNWYDQTTLSGSITIVLQFIYLIFYFKKCSLENIYLPKPLAFLQPLIDNIKQYINSWLIYPLVICTAIFLYWSFDKSILTLLWVVECFMLFILSVILKEKYFRYVALVALLVCIARLTFYDLAQSSTLTRALVFFGVGIIMLVMNSIYNKYKDRFTNE